MKKGLAKRRPPFLCYVNFTASEERRGAIKLPSRVLLVGVQEALQVGNICGREGFSFVSRDTGGEFAVYVGPET